MVSIARTAILKMLAMVGKSQAESFQTAVSAIRPVPVCRYLTNDPCAPLKARELSITERDGAYIKRPDEDVQSIAMGIIGMEGRVRLHFGEPITAGNTRDTASSRKHH